MKHDSFSALANLRSRTCHRYPYCMTLLHDQFLPSLFSLSHCVLLKLTWDHRLFLQVKQYLEAYTTTSIRGIPTIYLAHVQSLYEKTLITSNSLHTHHPNLQTNFSESQCNECKEHVDDIVRTQTERMQRKLVYLVAVANLWSTQQIQFGDEWLSIGLIIWIASMVIYVVAVTRDLEAKYVAFSGLLKSSKMQRKFHGRFPFHRILLGSGVVEVTADTWSRTHSAFL